MEINQWKTDRKLLRDGVWREIDEGWFLIARAGTLNPNFVQASAEEWTAFNKEKFANEDEKESEAVKVVARVTARSVMLAWRPGTVMEGGVPLEPTLENRIHVLTEAPELLEKIADIATARAEFVQAEIENTVGKSESYSNGSANGVAVPNGSSSSSRKTRTRKPHSETVPH